MMTSAYDSPCNVVVIREVDSDYYRIKQPIRVLSVDQPDGTCSAAIHEVEIVVDGIDMQDAICRAFNELFFLYDIIVEAPLSYVLNDEVLFFRHYLDNHIAKIF